MASDKELDQELEEIATRVERLRVHFQAYFLGMEKRPPLVMRDQLERYIRNTPLNEARKAIHKFRFQTAVQRYRIMEVYWDRTLRELEEGRTTREQLRQKAGYRDAPRAGADEPAAPVVPPPPRADEVAGKGAERAHEAPATPPSPPSKAVPRPGGAAVDPVVGRLFQEFVAARKSLGLPVEGITPDAFAASLEKQRQAQAQKLGVPSVTFSVVVKEGRVVLMARPVAGGGESR